MNVSYERVSTVNQDERRQELSFDNYKIDKRYIDKGHNCTFFKRRLQY
jgi:hypothetical protein